MKKIFLSLLIGIFLIAFRSPLQEWDIASCADDYPLGPELCAVEHTGTVWFGGVGIARDERCLFPTPPEGKGTLMAKVVRDGKPVRNVQLRFALNSMYETVPYKTDESGFVNISLQTDKWYINVVEWKMQTFDPYARSFIMISEDEYKLGQDVFQDDSSKISLTGKEIVITEGSPERPHIVLIIKESVKIEKSRQESTISGPLILREPCPNTGELYNSD